VILIQILLPLADNRGKPLPRKLYQNVTDELSGRFKGLTVYSRAPAEGIWKPRQAAQREEIVIYEVMVKILRRRWWKAYRASLEKVFRQETIVIRAERIEIL
jgi:hypothetical protein